MPLASMAVSLQDEGVLEATRNFTVLDGSDEADCHRPSFARLRLSGRRPEYTKPARHGIAVRCLSKNRHRLSPPGCPRPRAVRRARALESRLDAERRQRREGDDLGTDRDQRIAIGGGEL